MKMPALFLGHGSPLNAIEDNAFRRGWADVARRIPRPGAVLCISAHWKTRGLAVTASERPETIHDFCGFPPDLFAVRYPAPGDPALAPLREEGVLVIGSGDIVHNLRLADFSGVGSEGSDGRTDTAEDWAERFDRDVRQRIRTGDLPCLISCRSLGPDAALAIPTPEHYLPLLYVLACGTGEPVSFFNEGVVLGSISMTCVLVGDTA